MSGGLITGAAVGLCQETSMSGGLITGAAVGLRRRNAVHREGLPQLPRP